ncbi:hypothetical protein HME9304_03148 [Flagellimonas maritima]|uniref:Uncharacterized protein n=1 Tax=Flagellimonas maritima TaxID=1383885 RepID=A0A2Z4LWH0_9FLAO|nr:hypothetical protein HME9304_03148 [Allomuricauda aurantiaca]
MIKILTSYIINKLISENSLQVTYRLLTILNINIPFKLIKSRLCGHQNYGTLLSIYETFESFGLEVDASINESKKMNKYKKPFIAQIKYCPN